MRKKLTLLIIGIIFTNLTYSQNEMKIGLNTGINISKFRGNLITEGADNKIGFLIGVNFEYYLKNNLSIKTNLNYEKKRFTFISYLTDNLGLPLGELIGIVSYNYLELPILLKYEIGNPKRIFINGGPIFNYLLNVNTKVEGYLSDNTTTSINQLDLGISLGIGTIFHIDEKNDLNIELRYSPDLVNLTKEKNIPNPIKTNTLSLIANWNLKI